MVKEALNIDIGPKINSWLGPVAPPDDSWTWFRSVPEALSLMEKSSKFALAWDTGTEGVTGLDCLLVLAQGWATPEKEIVIYEKDPEHLKEMLTLAQKRFSADCTISSL